VLGAVADARGTQIAMVIPLVGFCIAWTFPLYLNLSQAKRLDGYNVSELGVRPLADGRIPSVAVARATEEDKSESERGVEGATDKDIEKEADKGTATAKEVA